jgi:hypothetical protein
MPNISNVRLKVTNGDDGKSTARVTYRLLFKQGEVDGGARYRERVTLVEDNQAEPHLPWDPPIDELPGVPVILDRTTVAQQSPLSRDETSDPFKESLLDNELGPDEIRARVELSPLDPDVFRGRSAMSRIYQRP